MSPSFFMSLFRKGDRNQGRCSLSEGCFSGLKKMFFILISNGDRMASDIFTTITGTLNGRLRSTVSISAAGTSEDMHRNAALLGSTNATGALSFCHDAAVI